MCHCQFDNHCRYSDFPRNPRSQRDSGSCSVVPLSSVSSLCLDRKKGKESFSKTIQMSPAAVCMVQLSQISLCRRLRLAKVICSTFCLGLLWITCTSQKLCPKHVHKSLFNGRAHILTFGYESCLNCWLPIFTEGSSIVHDAHQIVPWRRLFKYIDLVPNPVLATSTFFLISNWSSWPDSTF